jgi:hypothetical protein
MWFVHSAESLRSAPPPADAAEELRYLKDLRDHRTAADLDSIAWWNVGGPVYRWNQIAVDELLDHGVNTLMASRHLTLLHGAIEDAVVAAWDSKLAHSRLRPSHVDPTLATALPVLASPSCPSDFAAATTAAIDALAFEPTPKSNAAALYWEAFGGLRSYALWNEHGRRLILEYGLAADPPKRRAAAAVTRVPRRAKR